MNIAKAIRIFRVARGMDQRQLAKATSVTPSAISLIEAGKRCPSLPILEVLANALRVPTFVLVLASEDQVAGDREARALAAQLLGKFLGATQ